MCFSFHLFHTTVPTKTTKKIIVYFHILVNGGIFLRAYNRKKYTHTIIPVNISCDVIILICTQIYIPSFAQKKKTKKFTTKISTKNISKKLNCLVYISSIERRWSGKKKNWSEHNHQSPYKCWMTHTITLRVVVNKKLTFVVPYIV